MVIVWVVFELAKRPENIAALRSENILETDDDGKQRLTYASLRNAERLDSFIREVMRTKGETLSTVRQTTKNVQLGGYIIPEGQKYHSLLIGVEHALNIVTQDLKFYQWHRYHTRAKFSMAKMPRSSLAIVGLV